VCGEKKKNQKGEMITTPGVPGGLLKSTVVADAKEQRKKGSRVESLPGKSCSQQRVAQFVSIPQHHGKKKRATAKTSKNGDRKK